MTSGYCPAFEVRQLKAGFDEVQVQQIGADQDGFFAAWEMEVFSTFS